MAGKRHIVGDVTREYCEKFVAVPSLQLARMLKRDHAQLYRDVEAARRAIRYYRGANGTEDRGNASRSGALCVRETLPTPEPSTFKPEQLPAGKWLILADCHIPYHDVGALACAIEYGRKTRCDSVLLLGDFIDCHTLSRFVKDPRKRAYGVELDAAASVLGYIRAELKTRRIWWKAGNHEDRLTTFLYTRAPELLDVSDAFSIPGYLGLAENGVHWVEPQNPIERGHLNILHGHEWRGGQSTPVNPARSAFLRGLECTIVGHQHKTSEHTDPTVRGTTITCWSVGCLCGLHPDYMPLNRWNHGFAALDARGETWRVDNRRIVSGEVV